MNVHLEPVRSLVHAGTNGEPITTSVVIAEGTESQHRAVLQLIRLNLEDFEEFGRVAFEMQPLKTAGGVQTRTVAVLNRDQATLLMTYMRNSEIVRAFKKALVKAFSALERQAIDSGLNLPQDYASALRELAAVVESRNKVEARRTELEAQAELNRPKVLFADAVSTAKTHVLVGDLAKILRGNGIQVGGTRLFKWLRANGFLISRRGMDWNMPTQRSMEMGLFKVKETTVVHSDGHTSLSKTPKVTGKGQEYFISRFMDGRFSIDQVA